MVLTVASCYFRLPGPSGPGYGSPEDMNRNHVLRVLIDPPPISLNPRNTVDATGQRLNALIFRGLTRIDENLDPQPDLAKEWKISPSGVQWSFVVRGSMLDHGGDPITAEKITLCLENYRKGIPPSLLRSAFPGWETTSFENDSVIMHLKQPDPYLARNISVLRYFRSEGGREPCAEPDPHRALIGNGPFKPLEWDPAPENSITLLPVRELAGELANQNEIRHPVQFIFAQDNNTKVLKLLRGEVDAIQNSLSLTKTQWLRKNHGDRFKIIERNGVPISYLTFNFRDPILKQLKVRKAISEAINRDEIIRNQLQGFCTPAGSLLSPLLPESYQVSFSYDPVHAEQLLNEAGFPRKSNGFRFSLHYKTTPAREGIETALLIQDMLKKIGIDVVLDVVETAVFFASIRTGAFQLYASRWLGIADGSILYRTLRSGEHNNRARYVNAKLDEILDVAVKETDFKRRVALLKEAQIIMGEDLPYFPLWYWNNTVILSNNVGGLDPERISLSGGLEPLTHLGLVQK